MIEQENLKNGQIISVINMKGGVGKTTLSIGLSDLLSDREDINVLLIDADPQFNSTQALLDNYKSKGYEDPTSEKNFYSEEVLPKGKTIYKL
ncbi:TPA: ParA family protein, partial [Listeria innocua]|nr:ParA family protein [Listeria innocua]